VVRKEDLPLIGISYNFVGADQGDVAISMFLVEAPPGQGAPLQVHEYDEVVLVQEGRSRFVISDAIREAGPGEILVVRAKLRTDLSMPVREFSSRPIYMSGGSS
jgi:mannose-6-phosphate isomerase-like protein (cupin superfamily)